MLIAQSFRDMFGTITPPREVSQIYGGDETGTTGVNNFLTNIISLLFLISTIVFVMMVLWAAYDFIFSFGDKESIAKAKAKITWAIVGFIILSLSFVIFKVLEQITGIKFLIV